MRKMVMLVSAVVAAQGVAVAGSATERGLSPPPAEALGASPMGLAWAGCGVSE
jgi:hypothetical protein